jgi:polygalacturonase
MNKGHGAVTIGSEMSGGVNNLTVRDCLFLNTDRGLRIKTRRGRGKDAVLDQIVFENIRMNHVLTPFAVNSFYFCDPDGHTEYVRTKEKLPADERTPLIKKLVFQNIVANNCHVAAFFIYGLPEQKIERVEIKNVKVTYAAEPKKGYPEMLEDIEAVSKLGLYANNIRELILSEVLLEGQEGEPYIIENVDFYENKEMLT